MPVILNPELPALGAAMGKPSGGLPVAAPIRPLTSTAEIFVYNVTGSGSVPALPKKGFLIGIITSDNSGVGSPVPSLAGWNFQALCNIVDTATTQFAQAMIAWPDRSLISQPSGTTLTLTNAVANSTYTQCIFRQFIGEFRGQILVSSGIVSATSSLTVTRPAFSPPGAVHFCFCLCQSGGAGPALSTDSEFLDISNPTAVNHATVRWGQRRPPASTTFAPGRAAKMDAVWLVLR